MCSISYKYFKNGYPNHLWYVHTNNVKVMAIIRFEKLRQVHLIVRKWVEDKWNANVIRQVNYQTHAAKLTQDWKHVHMVFKGAYIKIWQIHFSINKPSKKWWYKCTIRCSTERPKNGQHRVIKFEDLIVLTIRENCWSWHVPLHHEK
jgi:hypothetical protein